MFTSQRKLYTVISLLVIVGGIFFAVNLTGNKTPKEVTLVTHDSFVMSKKMVAEFNKSSGFTLKLLKAGDAGSLTNRLILTKTAPIGDAVFGIDNTFSGVATSNGIIDGDLTPTDFGDVCFNYDKNWFTEHNIVAPKSIQELTLPDYKNLTVIENPNTSSTGLSFLAATVDKFGDAGWKPYWSALKANGLKVDSGWESAYYTDFSGSSGKGKFPIVLSYASSPADEVRADGQSQTASILDGCFRQTEYVGVLKNAKNPKGAKAVIKFLLEKEFQSTFPTSMYMYPISKEAPVPENWSKYTQIAQETYGSALNFNRDRKSWLTGWTAIFG